MFIDYFINRGWLLAIVCGITKYLYVMHNFWTTGINYVPFCQMNGLINKETKQIQIVKNATLGIYFAKLIFNSCSGHSMRCLLG
jgi:hypothetical protein